MRALTEGGRALSFYTIAAEDRSKHANIDDRYVYDSQIVEVMTPLVKGWSTEVAMEIASLGVQVHGGMGFVEETGAARICEMPALSCRFMRVLTEYKPWILLEENRLKMVVILCLAFSKN